MGEAGFGFVTALGIDEFVERSSMTWADLVDTTGRVGSPGHGCAANVQRGPERPLTAGLGRSSTWLLASSVMGGLGAAHLGSSIFFLARGAMPTADERAPGARLVTLVVLSVAAVVAALQFANVGFFRELWPFYVGLLAITATSLFQFAYVLFAPSRAEVRP